MELITSYIYIYKLYLLHDASQRFLHIRWWHTAVEKDTRRNWLIWLFGWSSSKLHWVLSFIKILTLKLKLAEALCIISTIEGKPNPLTIWKQICAENGYISRKQMSKYCNTFILNGCFEGQQMPEVIQNNRLKLNLIVIIFSAMITKL